MALLLVGDNRDSPNWGSRATSLALYRLLTAHGHRVSATLSNHDVQTRVPVSLLPPLTAPYRSGAFRRTAAKLMARGEKSRAALRLLGQADVVTEEPRLSLARVLQHQRHHPELRDLVDKVKNADAVVINGEGSMIFTAQPRRELSFQLLMIELAHHFGTPVFYVNAVVSDAPGGVRNASTYAWSMDTLERCAAVAVRDPHSHALVRAGNPAVKVHLIPDALFSLYPDYAPGGAFADLLGDARPLVPFPEHEASLNWDFSAPYICVGGSSAAAKNGERAVRHYTALVEELKTLELPLYLIVSCPGDAFLREVAAKTQTPAIPVYTNVFAAGAILARARLLVSGRYHPSIFASLGGTPCVFLGSDSHKTLSLQTLLGYEVTREYPAFPDAADNHAICERAVALLGAGEPQRAAISEAAGARALGAQQVGGLLSDG